MHKPFVMGVLLMLTQASAQAALQVEGPIASGPIGNAARDYPFSASADDLTMANYREDEFFFSGKGTVYNLPSLVTGSVLTSGHPYKTRVLVRRPKQAEHFNGVVVVEWLNVTAGFESPAVWNSVGEHMLRRGYAWVGVSAQETGLNSSLGLKAWNLARYESLHVSAPKAPIVEDSPLAYDIYSQIAQAVRAPKQGEVRLLGELQAKWLIATGASQSARRVSLYLNSVHPHQEVFDGALLLVSMGDRLRDDSPVKVAKLLSESDVIGGDEASARQPDGQHLVTWEVTGASHATHYRQLKGQQLRERDFAGQPPSARASEQTCQYPPYTPVPMHFVHAALLEHMRNWIIDGTQPPSAPPIKTTSLLPRIELKRDRWGNALGGIRLPDVEVPVARNSGEINLGRTEQNNRNCRMSGIYEAFDKARLRTLYPDTATYLSQVKKVLAANVEAGFILAEDLPTALEGYQLPSGEKNQ